MAFINLSHFGVEEQCMRFELTLKPWQGLLLTFNTNTAIDRLLLPITSSKVFYIGALIETYCPLDRRITLTQDEAFLQARSALEPERDYVVAQTGLEPTISCSQSTNLNLLGHCALFFLYSRTRRSCLTFYELVP